jgi:hypothetical protein
LRHWRTRIGRSRGPRPRTNASHCSNRPSAGCWAAAVAKICCCWMMCVRVAVAPNCSGFTINQFGGIMGHVRPPSGNRKSPSPTCATWACAASWSTAPTITARTRSRSAARHAEPVTQVNNGARKACHAVLAGRRSETIAPGSPVARRSFPRDAAPVQIPIQPLGPFPCRRWA